MRYGKLILGAATLLALVICLPALAGQNGAAGKGQRMQRLIAADTNGDGKITFDEAKAAFPNITQERFNKFDRNQDGVLSLADAAAANGQAGGKRGQMVQRLIAADTNGDGKVTFDEAKAAFPNITQERFNKFDRNQDGVLSLADAAAGKGQAAGSGQAAGKGQPGAHRAQMLQRLRAADTNGDGKVSFDEAKAAFPNLTQERFSKLDRNGDGVLSMADKPQGNGQAGGARRAQMIQRLRAADTNGDGKVSFDEAKAAFPKLTQERFNKLDRNQDGFLSEADRGAAAN